MRKFTPQEVAMYGADICVQVEREILKQERYMKRCSECEKKYGQPLHPCCSRYLCESCHSRTCKSYRSGIMPEPKLLEPKPKKQTKQQAEQPALF